MITCFSAFLVCFCDGEMTLPAGMVGDGQPDWGEDGCDSLADTGGAGRKWQWKIVISVDIKHHSFLPQSYAATCIKNCDQTLLGRIFFLEFYGKQPPFSVYFLRKL